MTTTSLWAVAALLFVSGAAHPPQGSDATPGANALSGAAAHTASLRTAARSASDSSLSVHATILIYDDFSTQGLVAVLRRDRGAGSPMLIMVKRNALTPALLFTAFREAVVARTRAAGDTMRVDIRLPRRLRLTRVPATVHPQLVQLVAELRSARSRDFGPYGFHPAIDFATTLSW